MKQSFPTESNRAPPAKFLPQIKYNDIDLVLPQRDFFVGGTIPFQVNVKNPKCEINGLFIRLMQTMWYTKSIRKWKFFSSHRGQGKKFKCASMVVAECLNPCYNSSSVFSGSWVDTLRIPLIPPTKFLSEGLEKLGCGEEIIQIQYDLCVDVNEGQEFGEIKERFPIHIKISPHNYNARNEMRNQSGSQIEFVHCQRRRQSTSISFEEVDADDIGFVLNDRPPRYSMLSLPILDSSSRSNSVETLPPYYEDVVHLQRE